MNTKQTQKSNHFKNQLRWLSAAIVVSGSVALTAFASSSDKTATLESKASLQEQINRLHEQNIQQQLAIKELQNLLSCVIKIGNDVILEGCNLHVRNAQGQTDTTDDTGNLIIGYNEDITLGDGSLRTGSHNLIIGMDHRYTSWGTIVHGTGHHTSNHNAAAIGGAQNRPQGVGSVIVSGSENIVSSSQAVILGGTFNQATGSHSMIAGGESNVTHAYGTSIMGGFANEADGNWGITLGGQGNQSMGGYSVVVGGQGNEAWGSHSTVSGGLTRSVNGPHDWRAGALFQTQ